VGNFSGEPDFLEQKECLAANPKVYAQLVTLLGKYSKFASAGEKAFVRQAREKLLGPSAAKQEPGADDAQDVPR
jgi:myo-inositol-1(or 4)-monophosphatase